MKDQERQHHNQQRHGDARHISATDKLVSGVGDRKGHAVGDQVGDAAKRLHRGDGGYERIQLEHSDEEAVECAAEHARDQCADHDDNPACSTIADRCRDHADDGDLRADGDVDHARDIDEGDAAGDAAHDCGVEADVQKVLQRQEILLHDGEEDDFNQQRQNDRQQGRCISHALFQ